MRKSNTYPGTPNASTLPAGAFGCTPREFTEEEDDLLMLLISQLDELTRPHPGGKLK